MENWIRDFFRKKNFICATMNKNSTPSQIWSSLSDSISLCKNIGWFPIPIKSIGQHTTQHYRPST
jgi:hypothetical protein